MRLQTETNTELELGDDIFANAKLALSSLRKKGIMLSTSPHFAARSELGIVSSRRTRRCIKFE